MYKFIHLVCVSIVFGTFSICFAADDPSIQGAPREKSQAAMNKHVGENSYNDHYIIYDAVDGKLRRLKFKELHSGLVKKGDFYVSCADFVDDEGNTYDLDFLVGEKDGEYSVYQAIVHKVNGKKRQYNIE
ncbi:hypothetical protein MYX76_05885 [Desulfobacterota bacterium AH_259_B03_O07]|nr:hypothetical protein [Desulfobacterota bacterium AH_259_B03_O07]